MPAGSEAVPPRPPVSLPHTWRPLGPRVAGLVAGTALVVVVVAAWLTFDDQTRAAFSPFQRGTVAALMLLGLACLYALTRSRVEARPDRLVVVNGYRRREYEWAEVVAAHLPPGAPWVTLDLSDGTTVSAMGIQGSDGVRARAAVAELRRLLARS